MELVNEYAPWSNPLTPEEEAIHRKERSSLPFPDSSYTLKDRVFLKEMNILMK
jgi:hypothetical protein